jgi:catechol 2,3-dioxygenase-like lactoylglutathione lyase family enzyme
MDSQLLESLDYLYVPAPDFEAAVAFYTGTLGGQLRWRIRHGSAWVAAVRLADASPLVLLANHLEPGQLLPIYRTRSLTEVQHALSNANWAVEGSVFELPPGPCLIFRDPGGQRVAVYQRVRPEVEAGFEGRFDVP